MNFKSKKFWFFLIVGFYFLAIGITGLVFFISYFGVFENPGFTVGITLFPIGFVIGIFFIITALAPIIFRASLNTLKRMQKENLDIIKTIHNNTNDAFADRLYCKHCGKIVDKDSTFCKFCGKEI